MIRLRWLAKHIPVPAVEGFVGTQDEAWLLMTAVPGQTAYQLLEAQPDARARIVDALASFLRRLHSIPVSECPFTSDHAYRLSRARERIDAGLVEEGEFDEEREGWTAEQVWEAMQLLLPIQPDPVVTHGDFSLDNIPMLDGKVVGCIDVGRVGIADRYQDLAILWNCLGEFDASLQDRLLEQYGIPVANGRKLQFHLAKQCHAEDGGRDRGYPPRDRIKLAVRALIGAVGTDGEQRPAQVDPDHRVELLLGDPGEWRMGVVDRVQNEDVKRATLHVHRVEQAVHLLDIACTDELPPEPLPPTARWPGRGVFAQCR